MSFVNARKAGIRRFRRPSPSRWGASLRRPLRAAAASFVVFSAIASCGRTQEQRAPATDSANAQQNAASGASSSATTSAPRGISKTLRINEAALLLRLAKPLPEPLVGSLSADDLFRSFYAERFHPEVADTLVVTDFFVTPVHGKPKTYFALVKTLKKTAAGEEERLIDIFAFKDTTASNIALGYAALETEFEDFDIENVSANSYQITRDGDYALSFECAAEFEGVNDEKTRMLYLFRLTPGQGQGVEQILEFCVMNKSGESPNASGVYEVQTLDTASVATHWKWNKQLYSLVITKTSSRKGDVSAGPTRTRTLKIRTHYDWLNGKYVEVSRQDVSRSAS